MTDSRKCPSCRRLVPDEPDHPWRPFCSERCRLVDLGDWLTGRHAIPGEQAPEADEPPDTDAEVKH